MTLVLGCGIVGAPLCAQTVAVPAQPAAVATELPAYDVVTIKPDKSASGMVRVSINENVFSAENVSLKMLLADAYGVHEDDIFGLPDWTNGAHFDITAKILNGDADALRKLTQEQRGAMLQPLLADRFKLAAHRETKTLKVYNLVVGKGGSKLQPFVDSNVPDKVTGRKGGGWMRATGTSMTGTGVELKLLVNNLTARLHHTIIDKTGLTGKFSFTLDWTPDPSSGDSHESSDAAIFTALQEQLGLKLESAKGPVETLVVDHVEMPSED